MKFTGGDALDGFKKLNGEVFMYDELRNGASAYKTDDPKTGGRGYSFGRENTGRFYQRPRQCTGSDKPCRAYFAIVLTLLYGISFSYAGEPEKHYPPYPDVWGYELPMPRKDGSSTRTRTDQTAEWRLRVYFL